MRDAGIESIVAAKESGDRDVIDGLRRMSGADRHAEPPSRRLREPVVKVSEVMLSGIVADEWHNDYYHGHVRRFDSGFAIGGGVGAVITIVSLDGTARHDWRDFQQIKNHLVGEEWEAVELYPAESRLVDPSNAFYLYCVPKGVFHWGSAPDSRDVRDAGDAIAAQRPFPLG